MRLSLKLKTKEKNYLPADYRTVILSFLKNAFGQNQHDKVIYFNDDGVKNNHLRDFTFAVYLPRAVFQDGGFILPDGSFMVNFSTRNYETGIMLYNGLLKLKDDKQTNYGFDLESVHLNKQEKTIFKDEIIVKTLSPVVVKRSNEDNNHDAFFAPTDEQFLPLLKQNSLTKSSHFLGKELNITHIEVLSSKKIPVKLKDHFVEGYQGVFKIKGDAELLNLLYQVGLGFKNGYGFGMLEVVE